MDMGVEVKVVGVNEKVEGGLMGVRSPAALFPR